MHVMSETCWRAGIPYLKTVIYNGQLIAIITIPTNQLLPPEYIDTLKKLCQVKWAFCRYEQLFPGYFEY